METEGPGMRDTYAPSPGLRLAFHGLPDQGPTSPLAEQECYPHLGAGGWGGVGEETPTLARLTGSRLEPHSHPGTHGQTRSMHCSGQSRNQAACGGTSRPAVRRARSSDARGFQSWGLWGRRLASRDLQLRTSLSGFGGRVRPGLGEGFGLSC